MTIVLPGPGHGFPSCIVPSLHSHKYPVVDSLHVPPLQFTPAHMFMPETKRKQNKNGNTLE